MPGRAGVGGLARRAGRLQQPVVQAGGPGFAPHGRAVRVLGAEAAAAAVTELQADVSLPRNYAGIIEVH